MNNTNLLFEFRSRDRQKGRELRISSICWTMMDGWSTGKSKAEENAAARGSINLLTYPTYAAIIVRLNYLHALTTRARWTEISVLGRVAQTAKGRKRNEIWWASLKKRRKKQKKSRQNDIKERPTCRKSHGWDLNLKNQKLSRRWA